MVSIALAYATRRMRTREFSERICTGVARPSSEQILGVPPAWHRMLARRQRATRSTQQRAQLELKVATLFDLTKSLAHDLINEASCARSHTSWAALTQAMQERTQWPRLPISYPILSVPC